MRTASPLAALPYAAAIALRILTLRGQRVIVDAELAQLYDVPTKRLNEAVKRNLAKFPPDFIFTLTHEEFANLRSQSATSSSGYGGRRYLPRVFTEHGALMAATILNSPRAVEVSIYVVRGFVRMRELACTHADLAKRLDELDDKTEALAMGHETFSRNTRNQLKQVFDAVRELMTPPDPPKRPIGFISSDDKGSKKASKSDPEAQDSRPRVSRGAHQDGCTRRLPHEANHVVPAPSPVTIASIA